jgi:hypothetical protein
LEWTTVLSTADQSQGLVSHFMSDDKRNHLLLSWAQVQKRSHGKKSMKKISAYDVFKRVFCKKYVPYGDGASTSKLRSGRTKNTNIESCRISDADLSLIATS